MATSKCRSCGADILWTKTANGKDMPLDAEPVIDGNIDISTGVAVVVKAASVKLYKSHYATCPQAGQWRNKSAKPFDGSTPSKSAGAGIDKAPGP